MILTCGEALIDMLPRTLADGRAAFMPVAGGAPFNTAIAVGRLGAPAGLFTGLSTDFFGDMLREALAASRVAFDLAATKDLPTTLAFVRLVAGQASYSFHDENTAGRMLTEAELPVLPGTVSTLLFGGISLIAEPCGSTYETMMRRAAAERVTMLDPNIRPGFVTDEAGYRERLDRMIALADIVKLSEDDLTWLRPGDSVEAAVGDIFARGVGVVIVTRGAGGATAHAGGKHVTVKPKPCVVADTVGAGDTFNAAVLTVLHERGRLSKSAIAGLGEDDLAAALELGAAAAAVTVSRPGADPPWRAEIAAS